MENLDNIRYVNRECYEPLEEPSCLWWYSMQNMKPIPENDCILACDGIKKDCMYFAPIEPQIIDTNKYINTIKQTTNK